MDVFPLGGPPPKCSPTYTHLAPGVSFEHGLTPAAQNGWGQIIGGFVAYGIAVGTKNHAVAIKSWQLVFLVVGLFTAAMGAVFLYLMPDSQLNARFLTPKERILAVERIRVNQQGVGNKHFKWYQCKEALTDPMVWAFVFYSFVADIPNGKEPLARRPPPP